MLNKRLKAGINKIHKSNQKINFCPGTAALIYACVMLLITAAFTQIKISFNIPAEFGIISYLKFEYIPQIPVVLFTAALLGESWGVMSILIYILLGLTPWFPVFALGGGLSYIFQYNFGYIFGFIFAAMSVSKELKRSDSLRHAILAVLYGVFIIHAIGIIYMTVTVMLRHDGWDFIGNIIYFQSLSKILYDLVFGFLAVLTAKIIRRLLWIIMG